MPEPRQLPRESLFKNRSVIYKLGLFGLLSSFILFIIGFSSPHWIRFDNREDNGDDNFRKPFGDVHEMYRDLHAGLWGAPCISSGSACNTGILVAQIAFCFHLAGYVISLVVALYENCKRVDPVSYYSRVLELCVFVTGILGTAGMAVFVVWYSTSFPHTGFKWSLVVVSLSLTGIYMAFLLLFFGNRKQFVSTRGAVLLPPQQPGVIYFSPGNPGTATIVQNYQHTQTCNQPQPLQGQPNLPPQPYFYPPISHHQAPPAYSLPPAYPLPPAPPQNFGYPGYPDPQHEGHLQASAPPYDTNLPQKS